MQQCSSDWRLHLTAGYICMRSKRNGSQRNGGHQCSHPGWLYNSNVRWNSTVATLGGTKSTTGLAKNCRMGLRWYFRCGCPISKPRPLFDFSSKTTWVFFFWKIKKWACLVKNDVFGNFSKTLMVLSNILANSCLTNVDLVCVYALKELFKKLFIRTSYRLYLLSISIEINRDEEPRSIFKQRYSSWAS